MNQALEHLMALMEHRQIDATSDTIMQAILEAIAIDAMERLSVIAYGDPDADPPVPPGKALNDPQVAPLWALAHAALYVGARMPGRLPGETDEAYTARARDAVIFPIGIKRGSHEAVRRSISPFLTGTKTISITDQAGGDPYALQVRTITAETPDPAAVQKALEGDYVSGGVRGAIRAELKLTYIVSPSVTWAEGTRAFNAVAGTVTFANVTYGDVT